MLKKTELVLVPFHQDTQESGRYIFRPDLDRNGSWQYGLHSTYQYLNVMILDVPIELRDPRKIWIYDTIPDSKWSTVEMSWVFVPEGQGYQTETRRRAYMFKDPRDLLLFRLRWEHT